MNTRRIVASAMISTAAAVSLAAAPASAAPALPSVITDLLNTGSAILRSAPPAPQTPGVGPSGVKSVSTDVSNYYGRKYGPDLYATGFAPEVTWSARDRGNGEVKGQNCQMEVSFSATGFATYRTAACQGNVGFSSNIYRTPGIYSITVTDRVSGASATRSFTIR